MVNKLSMTPCLRDTCVQERKSCQSIMYVRWISLLLFSYTIKLILQRRKWFPMEYYGGAHHGGVDGHYYHVFDTVRDQTLSCLNATKSWLDAYTTLTASILQDSRRTPSLIHKKLSHCCYPLLSIRFVYVVIHWVYCIFLQMPKYICWFPPQYQPNTSNLEILRKMVL